MPRDASGCTPLHAAAEWGETDMAQPLLLKGADKDDFDNGDETPLAVHSSPIWQLGNRASSFGCRRRRQPPMRRVQHPIHARGC